MSSTPSGLNVIFCVFCANLVLRDSRENTRLQGRAAAEMLAFGRNREVFPADFTFQTVTIGILQIIFFSLCKLPNCEMV